MIKTIKKGFFIFLGLIMLGWLSNILAFLIPQEAIHSNIINSAAVLSQEGPATPLIGEKYSNSITDCNTDAWMLLMADYNGSENILMKSLGGYYKTYENTSQTNFWGFDHFISSAGDSPIETTTYSYSRYWHGWLLPLRLLLLFFDYEDIRYIGMAAILTLLFYCVYLLFKKGMNAYGYAFFISSIFLLPITAMISFEYSFILYVTLIHNIILLKYYHKIQKSLGIILYFLCIGIIASYFDFLTYPLVSLGFTLITYLLLCENNQKSSIISKIKDIICCSISWGIGYAGMWISKWTLGTVILKRNVFEEAISQLILRTSTTDGISTLSDATVTYTSTLARNFEAFQTRGCLLISLIALFLFTYLLIKNKCYRQLERCLYALPPFAIILCMPFAWALMFQNHTYLHRNFTSNIFTISILAILGFFSYIISSVPRQNNES